MSANDRPPPGKTAATASTPRLDIAHQVLAALEQAQIVAALGGSGLLAALGLTQQVRDWDVTTDADPMAVQAALSMACLAFSVVGAGEGGFATRARFLIDAGDHEVDLIVGFAFREGPDVVALPTRVTGQWRGLPLGDPAVWARAYELMGRRQQAASLRTWLNRREG